MRLIDAEECPCYMCGATCPYTNPIGNCRKFNNWIMKTVYDVDKVCEELENKGNYFIDPWVSYMFKKQSKDIVKRGGING